MRTSKEIVNIIVERRKELGLSQRELAKRVGVSNSTLSRYEKFEREFPINDLGLFATALDLDINYMLGVEPTTTFAPNNQSQTDEKQDTDISEQLEQMMAELAEQKNALMFRGELMDDETKEAVLMAMQQAAKIAELSLKSNSQKDKEE